MSDRWTIETSRDYDPVGHREVVVVRILEPIDTRRFWSRDEVTAACIAALRRLADKWEGGEEELPRHPPRIKP